MATPPVGEHGTAARGSPPNGPPAAAHQEQEQQQREQQPGDGQQEAASPPLPDAAGDRPQVAADALAAQFQAQLEALTAISMGQVAPDSTVLAACGGRIPAAAVRAACPLREPRALACSCLPKQDRLPYLQRLSERPLSCHVSPTQVAELAEAARALRQRAANGAAAKQQQQQQQALGGAGSSEEVPQASKAAQPWGLAHAAVAQLCVLHGSNGFAHGRI